MFSHSKIACLPFDLVCGVAYKNIRAVDAILRILVRRIGI